MLARSSPTAELRPTHGWRSAHQWRLWLAGLVGSRYDGLRHFEIVEPHVLMRSGQPHTRDLDHIYHTHGLGAVFCARGGARHPLRGRWFGRERRWCAAHSVRFEHVRMSDAAPPPPGVFDRFLALIDDVARRPVLVHCEQGFHRTGLMVAAYRIGRLGWSLETAIDEMSTRGFDPTEAKRLPLVDALRRWATRGA